MVKVTSEKMELRGIANKQSKQGKVYYLVNVESSDGTPYSFYCKDANAFPSGLKKSDFVEVVFGLTYYKNQEQLVVIGLNKLG